MLFRGDETHKSLAGRIADRLVYPLLRPAAAQSLRRRVQACSSADDWIRLALNFHFGVGRLAVRIRPSQIHSEIKSLMELLAERKPTQLMEIGTNHGGTLFLFARVASDTARLISLDLPEGAFGGGYPRWKMPLFRSFASGRQEICLLRGDSHSPAALEQVRALVGETPLDFLFIDGDHSYEGVKKDFEQYRDLVRPGGLIAFHDIMPGHPQRVGGVERFWKEIRSSYPHREFIDSPSQKGLGIGVLFV